MVARRPPRRWLNRRTAEFSYVVSQRRWMGDIVLMKSDPLDVLSAIQVSKATVRKMKQNLFWAAIYNVIAIPIAAGALFPAFGLMLRPEFGPLAMSAFSITVVSNALRLRRDVPTPRMTPAR